MDDNADCVDHGRGVDPSDGANIASTVGDNMDEHIADKVDDTAVAENSCKWDAAVSELAERSAVVADLVQTDTAGRKPDWAASFAEYADSPPVPAVEELAYSEYLVHSDVAASSDSATFLVDGDCAEWALRARIPVAYLAEQNLQSRLH